MEHYPNHRRNMANNSGRFQSRRDLMVDQNQNPPANDTDNNPELEKGDPQERKLEQYVIAICLLTH